MLRGAKKFPRILNSLFLKFQNLLTCNLKAKEKRKKNFFSREREGVGVGVCETVFVHCKL